MEIGSQRSQQQQQQQQQQQHYDLPVNINSSSVGSVNSSNDSLADSIEVWDSDFEFATPVSILNGPLQGTLLALLVLFSISANACVINNIRHNCIKLRSTHFILIQHLCLADLIGASLILPAPLVTSLTGKWEGGERLCHLSSVVNVALWLQHVFMFAMLKVPSLFNLFFKKRTKISFQEPKTYLKYNSIIAPSNHTINSNCPANEYQFQK